MMQNVLKYVKSKYIKNAINYALPILIFSGIASMSGYHTGHQEGYQKGYQISQKQEQEKHSSDNITIRMGDDNTYSLEGMFAGQHFFLSDFQHFAPNSKLVKSGLSNNKLDEIIMKNNILNADGTSCYRNLDVKVSKYNRMDTDLCLLTNITITPKK